MPERNSLGLGGDGDEVEFVREIEALLDIEFQNEDLQRVETLGDLTRLVREKLRGKQPDLLLLLIGEIGKNSTGARLHVNNETTLI